MAVSASQIGSCGNCSSVSAATLHRIAMLALHHGCYRTSAGGGLVLEGSRWRVCVRPCCPLVATQRVLGAPAATRTSSCCRVERSLEGTHRWVPLAPCAQDCLKLLASISPLPFPFIFLQLTPPLHSLPVSPPPLSPSPSLSRTFLCRSCDTHTQAIVIITIIQSLNNI